MPTPPLPKHQYLIAFIGSNGAVLREVVDCVVPITTLPDVLSMDAYLNHAHPETAPHAMISFHLLAYPVVPPGGH